MKYVRLLAIPILTLMLVMSAAQTAEAYDQIQTSKAADQSVEMNGGDLPLQVSPSLPAARDPLATQRVETSCIFAGTLHRACAPSIDQPGLSRVALHFVAGSVPKPDPKTSPASPRPPPPTLNDLKVAYDNLKAAWLAHKDKKDGGSNGRDLVTLILAGLALLVALGGFALGYWRRTDE